MICHDLLLPIFQDSKQTIDVAFPVVRGATLVTTTKRGSCQAFTGMSRLDWKTDVASRSPSLSNGRGRQRLTFITFFFSGNFSSLAQMILWYFLNLMVNRQEFSPSWTTFLIL